MNQNMTRLLRETRSRLFRSPPTEETRLETGKSGSDGVFRLLLCLTNCHPHDVMQVHAVV